MRRSRSSYLAEAEHARLRPVRHNRQLLHAMDARLGVRLPAYFEPYSTLWRHADRPIFKGHRYHVWIHPAAFAASASVARTAVRFEQDNVWCSIQNPRFVFKPDALRRTQTHENASLLESTTGVKLSDGRPGARNSGDVRPSHAVTVPPGFRRRWRVTSPRAHDQSTTSHHQPCVGARPHRRGGARAWSGGRMWSD